MTLGIKCKVYFVFLSIKITPCLTGLSKIFRFMKNAYVEDGPGSVVRIATGYGLDCPWIESRWVMRFSAPVQTGPGAHPTSCTMGCCIKLKKKIHILLSQVCCVWQVVKTPTIISNNPVLLDAKQQRFITQIPQHGRQLVEITWQPVEIVFTLSHNSLALPGATRSSREVTWHLQRYESSSQTSAIA